jgi:hypothetical protein
MNKRIMQATLAPAMVMMFASPGAGAQSAQPSVDGVWQVVRHGVNCQTGVEFPNGFHALMTFHKDGTIHGDAVGPGSTAAEGTAEHGVWQRQPGSGHYAFNLVSYGWDDTGAFEGSGQIAGDLQLSGFDTFTYDAQIKFFDPNGALLVTLCGRAHGTRFR